MVGGEEAVVDALGSCGLSPDSAPITSPWSTPRRRQCPDHLALVDPKKTAANRIGQHFTVGDVAAFAIPDPDGGEQVKVAVAPAPEVEPGPQLAQEVAEPCSGRLASFKVPKSFDFVDELPRDPNGKLYERRLRGPCWAGLERST